MRNSLFLLMMMLAHSLIASNIDVTVKVTNIQKLVGDIIIALYDDGENFGKEEYFSEVVIVPANSDTVTAEIKDLKEGEYAFTVLHDENSNQKCDYNFLGIPKESIGFSNNVRPKLKMPSFEEVKVYVKDKSVVNIELIKF